MDLEEVQKEIQETKDVKIEVVNILFLDISSSCTGYAIATVNFTTKSAKITKAGCLWLNPDWKHQEKYYYMFAAMQDYFWVVEGIDYVVVEQYSVNAKKMSGINVVSEMQGAIKAGSWSNGVIVSSILPQSWRSVLKIKPVTTQKNGKASRDYKKPTQDKVAEVLVVPTEMISNITGNSRGTPSDVCDAIAIGWAWLTKLGIKELDWSSVKFNDHVGVINK